MNLKSNEGIAVLRNTIMLLRISYLFPSKDEVNHPEKNVHIKFTLLTIFGSYFPIGILIHLIVNIKRKYLAHNDKSIFSALSHFRLLIIPFSKFSVPDFDGGSNKLCIWLKTDEFHWRNLSSNGVFKSDSPFTFSKGKSFLSHSLRSSEHVI